MTIVANLTDDEKEIARQLCMPQKIACANLQIGHSAWKMRVSRLLKKFGVENRTALLLQLLKRDLYPIDFFEYREFNDNGKNLS